MIRSAAALALLAAGIGAAAPPPDPDMAMKGVPWPEVLKLARAFVEKESPPGVYPFERSSAAERSRAPHKVFIHYFPPYPISFDNKPPETDFWTTGYLSRDGEGGRHADVGGYVRQRPIFTQVWASPHWKEINAAIDVLRAAEMGADGFGVDIVRLDRGEYWDQARRLCAAATALHSGFAFIPEIDASILAKATTEQIADITANLLTCPVSARLADGRALVIPFQPESQTPAYWAEVTRKLDARGVPIALVPDLLDIAGHAAAFAPVSAGLTFWGHKDVVQAGSAETLAAEHTAATEVALWMQPIANQDGRPTPAIFWEAQNTALLRLLWQQAFDSHASYAHMVTWNDYGEGTEIAPSSGEQFAFYDLNAYYIEQFKTGHAPAIKSDAIYYTHRIEILTPGRPARPGEKPLQKLGPAPLTNEVEMVALLRAPATLRITQGGQVASADVGAGLQVLRAKAIPGRPEFAILRGGKAVVQVASKWPIVEQAERATPDYFGGSSTRR